MHSHGGFFKEHRDFKTLLKTDRLKFLCEQAFFGTEMCLFSPQASTTRFLVQACTAGFQIRNSFLFFILFWEMARPAIWGEKKRRGGRAGAGRHA